MTRNLTPPILALLLITSSLADDKTWTGNVDSDFLSAGNWNGGIPSSDDDIVIIDGGGNLPVIIPANLGELTVGAFHVGDVEAGSIIQNGGMIQIIGSAVDQESFIGLFADGTSSLSMNGDSIILYDEPFADGDGLDTDGSGKDFDVGKSVPEGGLGILELHDNAILRISDDLKLADGDAGNARLVMDGNSQITVGSGISVDGTTEIDLSGNARLLTGNSAGAGNAAIGRTDEGYLTLSTDAAGTSTVIIREQASLYARTLQQRDGLSTITIRDEGQFHVFDLFDNAEPSPGDATVTGSAQGPQRTSHVAQSPTAEMVIELFDDAVMTFDTELEDSEWSGLALSGGTNRGANAEGGTTSIELSDRASLTVAQDLNMTNGTGLDASSVLQLTGPEASVLIGGDLRMALDSFDEENEGVAALHAVITAESHSTVTVAGTANIGNGELVVQFGDYTPTGGESYDLITAATVAGTAFREVTLPPLVSPLAWNLLIDGSRVNLSILQPGDYNENGQLDAEDIDLLSTAVRAGDMDPKWDLNVDGEINNDDRVTWVNDLKGTYFGDATLDGEFNSSDLVAAFTAGKYNSGDAAGWAEGDWNGDMLFASGDLVAAFTEGGYEAGPRPAAHAVPEPSGLVFVLVGAVLIMHRRLSGRS